MRGTPRPISTAGTIAVPKFAGVIVAAILLSLFALVGTSIVILLIAAGGHTPALATPSGQIIQGVLVSILAVPTLLAWAVVVGLFRGRNWARIGGIVLGVMLTFFGVSTCLALIAMLLVPAMQARLSYGQQALAGAGLVYFLIAVFGVWLIVYFNLRSVRQAFSGASVYMPDSVAYPAPPFALQNLAGAASQPSAVAPVHGYASVPLQQQQRPGTAATSFARVLVLFFTVLICIGAMSDFVLAALRRPFVYLGLTLHPPTATIALVLFAAIRVAIALGLFRRFAPAYYAAIVLHLCNMTSSAMRLAHFPRSSGGHVVAATTHIPSPQTPQSAALVQGMRISFTVFYALFGLLALWALLSEIAAMRRVARGTGIPSDPQAVD
jgi:hypothetical protein